MMPEELASSPEECRRDCKFYQVRLQAPLCDSIEKGGP